MKGPSEQTLQWLRSFTEELIELLDDKLYSVTLYGSAATGVEYQPEVSDLNVLIVLGEIGPDVLQGVRGVLQRYRRLPLEPVFLTPTQLAQLPRRYPLEAWEIREGRKVLHGADIAAEWTVDPGDLARQLQSELLGKVVALRSLYVELGSHARVRDLEEALGGLIPPYRALMRALLRLLGHDPPPREFLEVLTQLEERYDFDLTGFRDAYQVRLGTKRLLRDELVQLLSRTLQGAEALAARGPQLLEQRVGGERGGKS